MKKENFELLVLRAEVQEQIDLVKESLRNLVTDNFAICVGNQVASI